MQELEKILEEINEIEDEYTNEDHDIIFKLGAAGIAGDIKDIIRNHMNDGWIPVEKELPPEPPEHVDDEDDLKEYIVMIDGAKIPTTLSYAGDGHWLDAYGEDSEYYLVIAWRPLPEPYRPERCGGK